MICSNCHGQRYFEDYFPCPECNGTGTMSCCGDAVGVCNMEAEEFDCIDCHAHVFSWGGNKMRCAVCTWIRTTPDLTEKQIAEIRVLTGTPILEKNND